MTRTSDFSSCLPSASPPASPSLASGSSAANAIFFPSGDHTGSPTPSFLLVSWTASPPSVEIRNSCVLSLPLSDRKTKRSPTGDQRGAVSFLGPYVNWKTRPSLAICMDVLYFLTLSSSMTDFTVNATDLPLGDIWGSETHFILHRSVEVRRLTLLGSFPARESSTDEPSSPRSGFCPLPGR